MPAWALWGAQTQRSLSHFAIGAQRMPIELVHAMARIKRAAARVNASRGLLPPAVAQAIAEAAAEVIAGLHDAQFPLSVWQTGSGTHSHMNVNEVLAALATRAGASAAGGPVDAHDHVNRGQSSNDVFPTAMHLAALLGMAPLRAGLARLRGALQAHARGWAGVVKLGRTHLQDALPVTLGAAFAAHDAQLALAERQLEHTLPELHALAMGGTAVGNGLGAPPGFGQDVVALLAAELGLPLRLAHDRLAATAGHEALVATHGALRLLAVVLTKLGADLRLMASGPRAGFGEINLPAHEPGSSFMPGKVNPTQVEAVLMVCQQVMGHDVAIGIAASQGQLELNACKPLIAFNLLDSQRLLGDAMASLARHAVQGLTLNPARLQAQLDGALMLAAALAPHIGHARAAAIAGHAQTAGLTLREAALGFGGLDAHDFDAWVAELVPAGTAPR